MPTIGSAKETIQKTAAGSSVREEVLSMGGSPGKLIISPFHKKTRIVRIALLWCLSCFTCPISFSEKEQIEF